MFDLIFRDKRVQLVGLIIIFFVLCLIIEPSETNILWRFPSLIAQLPIIINEFVDFLMFEFMPIEVFDPEIEEFEEYFEAVEKNWIIQIESLFIGEFSLTEDKIENYLDIREGYEEEKMIAFQEFHEYMIQKHGENYTFTPTPDMEQFENKVVQTYKEKMEQFLGENNYVRYKEVLEEYNNRLRREQDPDKGVILIEL